MAESQYGNFSRWNDEALGRFNTYGAEGNKKSQDYMLDNSGDYVNKGGGPQYTQGAGSDFGSFLEQYSRNNPRQYGNNYYKDKDRNQAAINYNQGSNKSYADFANNENLNDPLGNGVFMLNSESNRRKKDPPEAGMFDGMGTHIMGGIKNLGASDWGNLALGGFKAYQGFEENKRAKEQHRLATDAFQFQKAAWNKDYAGRQLAYNTNAQNVNAWKEAQGRTDLNKLMV
jgi:hypothetical protein